MPKAARTYYYAVRTGRKPGIYKQWSECELQVKGFPNARYKKFATEAEASAFISADAKESETKVGFDAAAGKMERTSTGSYIVDTFPASTSRQKVNNIVESAQNPEEGTSVVYTDGASSGNGTARAYAGVGVYFGPNDPRNVSEPLEGKATNQRAEIMAVIRAIEKCNNDSCVLDIRTDSMYTLKAVTSWRQNWIKKNWKTSTGAEVMNKDLFERLFRLIDNRPGEVKITHVPGHSGNAGNDMADRLAVQGAQMAARLKLGS